MIPGKLYKTVDGAVNMAAFPLSQPRKNFTRLELGDIVLYLGPRPDYTQRGMNPDHEMWHDFLSPEGHVVGCFWKSGNVEHPVYLIETCFERVL